MSKIGSSSCFVCGMPRDKHYEYGDANGMCDTCRPIYIEHNDKVKRRGAYKILSYRLFLGYLAFRKHTMKEGSKPYTPQEIRTIRKLCAKIQKQQKVDVIYKGGSI